MEIPEQNKKTEKRKKKSIPYTKLAQKAFHPAISFSPASLSLYTIFFAIFFPFSLQPCPLRSLLWFPFFNLYSSFYY